MKSAEQSGGVPKEFGERCVDCVANEIQMK